MSTEQATVTITMGGRPYTLRSTYDASRVLNRLAGGMLPLFRAVSNVDADTMTLIVAAGTGATGRAVEEIGRAAWAHGLEDLVDPLTRYLTLVCNGGRDPEAARPKVAVETEADEAMPEPAERDVSKSGGTPPAAAADDTPETGSAGADPATADQGVAA